MTPVDRRAILAEFKHLLSSHAASVEIAGIDEPQSDRPRHISPAYAMAVRTPVASATGFIELGHGPTRQLSRTGYPMHLEEDRPSNLYTLLHTFDQVARPVLLRYVPASRHTQ